MKRQSKTNWERVDAIKDEDIDYSDTPPLTAAFFEKAVPWRIAGARKAVRTPSSSDEDLLLPIEIKCFSSEYKEFVKIRRNNFLATVQMFPGLWKCFLLLDKIHLEEFSDLSDLREADQMMPLMLSIQAHSQYRFSFELAFSGALSEAMSLLRNGIESVAVAHKLHREPDLTAVWLAKDRGRKGADEYRRNFVDRRKESLFSSRRELTALHAYWQAFSEEGPHSNVRTLGRRSSFTESSGRLNVFLNYLEVKPDRLAASLLKLLHVSELLETVIFKIFESRLQCDENLLKNRRWFTKYSKQAKREIQTHFGSPSILPGIDLQNGH